MSCAAHSLSFSLSLAAFRAHGGPLPLSLQSNEAGMVWLWLRRSRAASKERASCFLSKTNPIFFLSLINFNLFLLCFTNLLIILSTALSKNNSMEELVWIAEWKLITHYAKPSIYWWVKGQQRQINSSLRRGNSQFDIYFNETNEMKVLNELVELKYIIIVIERLNFTLWLNAENEQREMKSEAGWPAKEKTSRNTKTKSFWWRQQAAL